MKTHISACRIRHQETHKRLVYALKHKRTERDHTHGRRRQKARQKPTQRNGKNTRIPAPTNAPGESSCAGSDWPLECSGAADVRAPGVRGAIAAGESTCSGAIGVTVCADACAALVEIACKSALRSGSSIGAALSPIASGCGDGGSQRATPAIFTGTLAPGAEST